MSDDSTRRRRGQRDSRDRELRDPDAAAEHLFDVSAEQALLGTILTNGTDIVRAVATQVSAEDFYLQKHQSIFQACADLEKMQSEIDAVLVIERLQVNETLAEAGGESYVASLLEYGSAGSVAPHYAKIVGEKATLRRTRAMLRACLSMVGTPTDDAEGVVAEVANKVFQLANAQTSSSLIHISTGVAQLLDDLEARSRSQHRGRYTGIASGYHRLDRITNGFQPSDLVILAARPGMGKTALALNMVCNAAMNADGPVTCAVFSLEMSATQLIQRIWSFHAKVPLQNLRAVDISESNWSSLLVSAQKLNTLPIYVDDTPAISVTEVRSKCRQLKSRRDVGLGLVVVDYLQLMSPSREHRNSPREQQISDISRSLKGMAKELGVPVIALSQLNRTAETRPDKRPQISDLRESGAIEQDADIILMIYRASYYAQKAQDAARKQAEAGGGGQADRAQGSSTGGGRRDDDRFLQMDANDHTTEILIEKHRAGETGRVRIMWIPEYTLFANIGVDDAPGPTDADAPPREPALPSGLSTDYPPPSDASTSWDAPMPAARYDDDPPVGPPRPFEPAPVPDDDHDF